MILHIEIDDHKNIRHNFVGGSIDNKFKMRQYQGKTESDFEYKIKELSIPLGLEDYNEFWEKYQKKRRVELERINMIYAIKKFFQLRPKDLKHITLADLKKQFVRISKIFR